MEPGACWKSSWYRSLPYFVKGDVDAFFALFSNNLATILAGCAMILPMVGKDIVYDRIFPGIAVAMLAGCIYYTIQAQMKAASTGRTDLCAQPFGVNTPGVFAFNGSIIIPIWAAGGGTQEAGRTAWHVAVAANLLQGVIEIALSIVGPQFARSVPIVALLGALASVGLAYLYTGTLQAELAHPLVGLVSFFLCLLGMYANVAIPKVPKSVLPVGVGTAIAWITGLAMWGGHDGLKDSLSQIRWHPGELNFDALTHLDKVFPYIGVTIPVALTVSIGTVQCRTLAAKAGDEYNIRASMFGDGLCTVIAALMGSPYGMTVFIGHSAFKEMGAKIGYSIMCGLATVLVCFSGLAAVVLKIVPVEALNPIILFVGLAICSDALQVTPSRHWPAFIAAIVPGIANWAIGQCESFGRNLCSANGATCTVTVASWTAKSELFGLYSLGQGYLLTSIYYASMLVYMIDREFHKAAAWAFIAGVSAVCGLIHSEEVFLPWSPPEGRPRGAHMDLFGAYFLIAVVFLACHACSPLRTDSGTGTGEESVSPSTSCCAANDASSDDSSREGAGLRCP